MADCQSPLSSQLIAGGCDSYVRQHPRPQSASLKFPRLWWDIYVFLSQSLKGAITIIIEWPKSVSLLLYNLVGKRKEIDKQFSLIL